MRLTLRNLLVVALGFFLLLAPACGRRPRARAHAATEQSAAPDPTLDVVFIVFAATLSDKGFLTPTNLLNVFRQTAIISIMAAAMTFVDRDTEPRLERILSEIRAHAKQGARA